MPWSKSFAITRITPAFASWWFSMGRGLLPPNNRSRTACRFFIRALDKPPTRSSNAWPASMPENSILRSRLPIYSNGKRPAPVAPNVFRSRTCGRLLTKRCQIRLRQAILAGAERAVRCSARLLKLLRGRNTAVPPANFYLRIRSRLRALPLALAPPCNPSL